MSLTYRRRWERISEQHTNLHCADFSPDGLWLAIAGSKDLLIVSTDSGETKHTVYNDTTLAAIQWLAHGKQGILVCGYSDGTILNITVSSVSTKLVLSIGNLMDISDIGRRNWFGISQAA